MPEPGNPQSLNRYSYVLNNPLRYTDPTGYFTEEAIAGYYGVDDVQDVWWWNDPDYADFQDMMLNAEAGDVLFGQTGVYHGYNSPFYHVFLGNGEELLGGINFVDGDQRFRHLGIDDYARQMVQLKDGTKRISWGGFMRAHGETIAFYVRQGFQIKGGQYSNAQRGIVRASTGAAIGTLVLLLPVPASEAGKVILGAFTGAVTSPIGGDLWLDKMHMQDGDFTALIYPESWFGTHPINNFRIRFRPQHGGSFVETGPNGQGFYFNH